MNNYLIALDLSLSNTGVCIFDIETENPVEIFSISTNAKFSHGERLRKIADKLCEVRSKYNISAVALEQGFTRFNISTQVSFKVHGIANYIFYDKPQTYYAPSSIKKVVSGNGKSTKEIIKNIIIKKYPDIVIKNEDESDAVSIGMCWFIKNKKVGR
jgi:Holliday junction resolvasome RuvABC endonuclease subunit